MFDDWLEILQRGTYDLALPTLSFSRGASLQCHGSGWLTWQHDTGLQLRATTDGARALLEATFDDDHLPVTLIPHDDYLRPCGASQDEWAVELTPVPVEGCHIHGPSPHVVWELRSPGVTLTRPANHCRDCRVLRGLLGPAPEAWVRGTQTEVHHPHFATRSGMLDWLEAETSIGRLVARRRTADWFEVVVYLDDDCAACGAFDVLNAVGRAFSFLLGRRVHLRGYEDRAQETDTRYLNAAVIRPTRNNLHQPLGRPELYRGAIEPLLGQSVSFFLTERGTQVARYLHLCWDTADNDIQTRMTIASVAVEGLLLLATSQATPPDPGFTPQDVDAAAAWLRANEATLSPRFVARLRNLLGTLNHRRPIDVLQDWRRRGVLGVTAEDVTAWQDLRNSTAHARLIDVGGDRQRFQGRLDQLRRVINVLNRIVLMLVGYTGQYTDYAADGWPSVPFPLPAPGTV
jgi:hypothetical protein